MLGTGYIVVSLSAWCVHPEMESLGCVVTLHFVPGLYLTFGLQWKWLSGLPPVLSDGTAAVPRGRPHPATLGGQKLAAMGPDGWGRRPSWEGSPERALQFKISPFVLHLLCGTGPIDSLTDQLSNSIVTL